MIGSVCSFLWKEHKLLKHNKAGKPSGLTRNYYVCLQ
jgi:hypothetical protein